MKQSAVRKKENIKLDLIGHLGILANTAIKSEGMIESINYPKESLERAKDFLELPDLHCILFSIILRLSFNDDEVTINNLSDYLECSNLAVIRYLKDIKLIEEKKLIRKCSRSNRPSGRRNSSLNIFSYRITQEVLDALMNEKKQMLHSHKKVDMISFLECIHELISQHDEDEITYDELIEEMNGLIHSNTEVPFIRRIENMHLSDDNKILLLYLSRETANGDNTEDLVRACEKIYTDPRLRFTIRKEIIKGRNELVTKDLIKVEDGLFRSDRDILLTDKALDVLFDEDHEIITAKNQRSRHLICPADIRSCDLFFNSNEQSRMSELKNLLSQEKFITIKQNLKEKEMPIGVAILFHGMPGTGKTAFAYQLAGETGRSIMMVDISDTKSMWFGESEKKIKKVFTDYRDILKHGKIEPILLFNECDAIFSTRKKIGRSSVDQTENNIQNIILQELENLQGILIATTNLTENLDNAFERRFLYKILFNLPDGDTREKIWMSKLPYLTPAQARNLATRYTFSGGNIENICRKIIMKEILYSDKPAYEEIDAVCAEELLHPDHQKKIGFRL